MRCSAYVSRSIMSAVGGSRRWGPQWRRKLVRRTLGVATIFVLLFASSTSLFADFQYTEKSKITGGALASSMKMVGVFSKEARQAGQGTTSTISVKGNKMRRESDAGTAEIVDLHRHRLVHLHLKHK